VFDSSYPRPNASFIDQHETNERDRASLQGPDRIDMKAPLPATVYAASPSSTLLYLP